jgi:cyclic nucleotide-binding protein
MSRRWRRTPAVATGPHDTAVPPSHNGITVGGSEVVEMRFESSVLSLSWIPSEAISGAPRLPFDWGVVHYDDPPPDRVTDPGPLVTADQVRLANHLRAWVEVEDERIVDYGYSGGGRLNVSTVHLLGRTVAFAAIGLPDLKRPPVEQSGEVTFVQTAGGRTGMPAPRRVSRPPFVQVASPPAWTTLTLTIDKHGHAHGGVVGASPFPRHWIYDASGTLSAKTGTISFEDWYRDAFGTHTPWGDTDSPAFVTEAETALERQLSLQVMRGNQKPPRRELGTGDTLVEQGERGDSLYLLLDGVLQVEVDGEPIAEVGPGAILGERALLESGRRTSTLRAVSPCRVVVVSPDQLDRDLLGVVSSTHRREEQRPGS